MHRTTAILFLALSSATAALAENQPIEGAPITPPATSAALTESTFFQDIRDTLDTDEPFDATDDQDWLKFLKTDDTEGGLFILTD